MSTAASATGRRFDLDRKSFSAGARISAAERFSENVLITASLLGDFERRETDQNSSFQYGTIGFQILDDREIDLNRFSVGGKLSAYWSPLANGAYFGLEAFFISAQVKLNLDDVNADDRFRTIKFGNLEENVFASLSKTDLTASWQVEAGARVKLREAISVSLSVFGGLEEEWEVKRRNGAISKLEADEALFYGAQLNIILKTELFDNLLN